MLIRYGLKVIYMVPSTLFGISGDKKDFCKTPSLRVISVISGGLARLFWYSAEQWRIVFK